MASAASAGTSWVAWHAAAAVLLYLALRLMTGRPGASLEVAALFAAHPLQVESVAWAAERSNVLAGFFFALTLLLWGRYARRPGPGRYWAALGSCALRLAAKPVLVVLPFVLLLLDLWPLGRTARPGSPRGSVAGGTVRPLLLEQLPFLACAAFSGTLAFVAHRSYGALASTETIPLGLRFGNAMLSYWREENPLNTSACLNLLLSLCRGGKLSTKFPLTNKTYKQGII